MRKRILYLAALLLLWPALLQAEGGEGRGGLFCYSPYGQSLLADVHPNYVRVDIASITNHQEWDWGMTGKDRRIHTFSVMGINLPLWSGRIGNHHSLSVAMPVSSTIWLDLFEPVTSPVVNTDYRIAAPVFTLTRHFDGGFARNLSVGIAPLKHESTHIGDEMALQRVVHQLPLLRVNVSENYSELTFSLNEADCRDVEWHTFKAGMMVVWNPRGWYFIDSTDGDASLAQPRFSPWEAYVQYQYQSPVMKQLFQYVLSAEVRNRALFGYPEFQWSPETGVQYQPQAESRVFTYNLFLGLRFCNPANTSLFSRTSVGLRLYHGNNPYGQFRNHRNFNHIGLCVIFE